MARFRIYSVNPNTRQFVDEGEADTRTEMVELVDQAKAKYRNPGARKPDRPIVVYEKGRMVRPRTQ